MIRSCYIGCVCGSLRSPSGVAPRLACAHAPFGARQRRRAVGVRLLPHLAPQLASGASRPQHRAASASRPLRGQWPRPVCCPVPRLLALQVPPHCRAGLSPCSGQAPVALASYGNPSYFSRMAIVPADSAGVGTGTNGVLIASSQNGNASTLQMGNNNRASGSAGSTVGRTNNVGTIKIRRGGTGHGTVGNQSVAGGAFKALDNRIVTLDQMYEDLADKTPWVDYAAVIDGLWSLCANCAPDAGAKKLFRQYNFNRLTMGLAPVETPVDGTESANVSFAQFAWVIHTTPPLNYTQLDLPLDTQPIWGQSSCGLSLSNPVARFLPTDAGVPFTSGPIYNFITETMNRFGANPAGGAKPPVFVQTCWWTDNGAPGFPFPAEYDGVFTP